MPALADLLSPADRRRLAERQAGLERERELDALDKLLRERGAQRPAPTMPALTELAERAEGEAEAR
jgi:hypothetical protein